MAEDSKSGPLEGIRVLDMSTMMAGPYGATLLGDLGADVIKIESHYGDESRHLGPERDGERSAFLSLNRNKRAVVLDLRRPSAQEAFSRLAATSDILITNIRGPALAKLGIDYEGVRKHRQDIIWIGVTAFGADGPYAGRAGIDFLAQGYAGLLALNGVPGGSTVRVTVPLIDTMTSLARRLRGAFRSPRSREERRGTACRHLSAGCADARPVQRPGQLSQHRRDSAEDRKSQPVLLALGGLHLWRREGGRHYLPVGEVLPQPVRGARRPAGRRIRASRASTGGSRTRRSSTGRSLRAASSSRGTSWWSGWSQEMS